MTRPKGTADLQAEIRTTIDSIESSPLPTAGEPTGRFDEAIEAIRTGDDEAAVEAMRRLDEARPRLMLPFFKLAWAEHQRLRKIVAASKGQAERAEQLDNARRKLRHTAATSGTDAEALAADQIRLDREWCQANNAALNAVAAERQVGALEAGLPVLFGRPASEQFEDAFGQGPAVVVSWPAKAKIEVRFERGWLFSELTAAPRPRRRLVAR
jgi:hypothetical protein